MGYTQEFEQAVVDTYLSDTTLSLYDVADKYAISRPTVSRILKRHNHAIRPRRSPEMFANEIITFYQTRPMTIEEVADKFKFCKPKIVEIFTKYNVKQYTREDLCLKDLDVDYFKEVDTQEKAYLLGFFYADACIYTDGITPRFVFQLKEQDSYIVNFVKEVVSAPRSVGKDKRDGSSVLAITSTQFCTNLERWGMTPYKKTREHLPQINEALMPHFIRGYFDGDGCASLHSVNGRTCGLTISFAGWSSLLSEIVFWLSQYAGMQTVSIKSEGGCFAMHWYKTDEVRKFWKYCYTDAIICLDRKRQIIENYLTSAT